MIRSEPVTIKNVSVFKGIRLKALQCDPLAFGSTFEREYQFSDADWATRIQRWNGVTGIGFMAMDGETACGIAGALVDENNGSHVELVSMWTDPAYRKRGVGRLLVEEIVGWVSLLQSSGLHLLVTSNNDSAIEFYRRLGFAHTGKTLPYPNDPTLLEYEMFRPIR